MKLDPTLLADWKQEERGWWISDKPKLGVCRERDGKWHSYITAQELPSNTPAFKTMRKAMIDAEKRYAFSGGKVDAMASEVRKRVSGYTAEKKAELEARGREALRRGDVARRKK